MARPLRIEFSGALYHVTSRGDRREAIFEDAEDRRVLLETLAEVVGRFNWSCHAYCLMTNHYHLVVETPDGNLSKGMRQLNGVYTQASNRRHGRCGHLFQGRYKGILVDQDSYLLELSRYVVLNPVRAGMVDGPKVWPWSSYPAAIGKVEPPAWLSVDGILGQFGNRRCDARTAYAKFVQEGIGRESIWNDLRQQIYLGDDSFVQRMQAKTGVDQEEVNIPKRHRRPPALPLEAIASNNRTRDGAIIAAYATGAYSYREIADYFGVHPSTVGRIVRRTLQCET